MTTKHYFDEPLVMEFSASVLQSTAQDDGTFHTILDATYFYPTGGGQPHDIGMIADVNVIDVQKDGDTVIHVTEAQLLQGDVVASVDKDYRWRNMQAHTGQHLLSAAFVHELDADTVAVKMSATGASTVDVTLGDLTPEQITQVEQSANRVIMENREVKSYFVIPENVPQEKMRRPLPIDKITGDVRIVEIVDWDTSACAGTHLPSTGMIGLLKILKVENYKGGSRVHFVAGYNTLDSFNQYQQVVDVLGNTLSTGVDTIVENVEKALDERKDLAKQYEAQRERILEFEASELRAIAEDMGVVQVVMGGFEDRDSKDLRTLANIITSYDDMLVLLVNAQHDAIGITVATSKNVESHAGQILRALIDKFGGRGGGNEAYAQGVINKNANLDDLRTDFDNLIAGDG